MWGPACWIPTQAGITAQFLDQDFETHDDDVFAVTLDPFLDRRNSFMFLINPRGAVKDGQTFDNSRTTNLAWEGVIQLETTIHDHGMDGGVGHPIHHPTLRSPAGGSGMGHQLPPEAQATERGLLLGSPGPQIQGPYHGPCRHPHRPDGASPASEPHHQTLRPGRSFQWRC